MRAIRVPRDRGRRVGGVFVLVLAAAVGCGGDDEETIPTTDELSAALLVADDLAELGTWEFSERWPGGTPGVIPEDQRDQLPSIGDLCQAATEAGLEAPNVRWEVGTQLDMVTDAAHQVGVMEFLIAGPADELSAVLADLQEIADTCIATQPAGGEVTPDGENIVTSLLTEPEVGDEQLIVRSVVEEPGGPSATWDVRSAYVRSGTVLMSVMVLEIDIGDAPVLLSDDDVATVLTVATDKLP